MPDIIMGDPIDTDAIRRQHNRRIEVTALAWPSDLAAGKDST